jgi:hypothetical protein
LSQILVAIANFSSSVARVAPVIVHIVVVVALVLIVVGVVALGHSFLVVIVMVGLLCTRHVGGGLSNNTTNAPYMPKNKLVRVCCNYLWKIYDLISFCL